MNVKFVFAVPSTTASAVHARTLNVVNRRRQKRCNGAIIIAG
jgi:hypothetical protein